MSEAEAPRPVALTEVLGDMLRLLTFRLPRERLNNLTLRHLAIGMVLTWLVGMGRYWDDPGAHLGQHLGLGSVVYVFVLSGILWAAFKPIAPDRVRYTDLAKFISLTAAPALLYAIPVERFLPLEDAIEANVWFLLVVAVWRVALLVFFMLRGLGFRWFEALFAGLLPLVAIVVALTALNLERAVFEIMGGLGPKAQTANDGAYQALFSLTLLSMMAAPVLLLGYVGCIARRLVRTPATPSKEAHSDKSDKNAA